MNRYQSKRDYAAQLFSFLLAAIAVLALPGRAAAQQALTWARIDFLRNRVQLIPRGRTARTARLADILGIGDALRTAPASRAELRFNDGSLARIGERATFRFTPNTRNFQLSNGTILLLIPPGRGRTTIQTPNAVTGIQGSGLFTRYIPETDTTIVGALTNNPQGPMVVYNQSGTEQQALYAHQMVVVEGERISRLYNFDLELFYETSGLAEGLNLTDPAASTGSDALDGVRQEILDALEQQPPLEGEGIIENPDFITPPPAVSAFPDSAAPVTEAPSVVTSAPSSSIPETDSREPVVAPREANPIEVTATPEERSNPPVASEPVLSEPSGSEAAFTNDAETEIDAEFPEFEGSPADQFLETDTATLDSTVETPAGSGQAPEETSAQTADDGAAVPDANLAEDSQPEPLRVDEPAEEAPADFSPETEEVLTDTNPPASDALESVPEDATTVPESTTDPDSVSPIETGIPSETLTEAPMPAEAMPEPATPSQPDSPPELPEAAPIPVDGPQPIPIEPPSPAEVEPPASGPPTVNEVDAPSSEIPETAPEAPPSEPPTANQTVPDLVDTPNAETLQTIEEAQPEQLPPDAVTPEPPQ